MTWVDTARRIVERGAFEMVHPVTGESVEYEWKPDLDGEYAEAQGNEVVVPKEGDGVLFDLFSAGTMVQVYDALGDVNKARFEAMPFTKAHAMAFKLLEKVSNR